MLNGFFITSAFLFFSFLAHTQDPKNFIEHSDKELPPRHTGTLLYQYKKNPQIGPLATQIMSKYDLASFDKGSRIHSLRLKTKQDSELLLTELRRSELFTFVDYDSIESLPGDESEEDGPSDISLANQWHHQKIASFEAWKTTRGSQSTVIAVCDSGIQRNHEDLDGRVLPGWNMIENKPDNSLSTSHGTFVGGLIAATLDQKGVAGVAPSVKLLPIRISNNKGEASIKLITDCILFAAERGAKVINVSFTGVQHPAIHAAGEIAQAKGSLLVYAAGNQGRFRSAESYPDSSYVLAVGATTANDRRWTFRKYVIRKAGSNWGPFIDLVAPGHQLFSTATHNVLDPDAAKYRAGSGTSYAAPVVSAVAGLVFSLNSKFTPKEVQEILSQSADRIGDENVFGAGRVNAAKAVRLALEKM